jgi:hypothetical protein
MDQTHACGCGEGVTHFETRDMRSWWASLFQSPGVRLSRLLALPSESKGDCVKGGGGL